MKRLFIVLIKYIPIIQMVGMLFNNILYCFSDIYIIRRVAEHADFNLWRRTCRMISGEVVLPNTPVIEGYASYNPCHIQSTTPAPAA